MKNLKQKLLRNNSPPIFYILEATLQTNLKTKCMKTIKLIFAITMLSFFSSNAQISKGNWMVGGSGNFSYFENNFTIGESDVTRRGKSINLSPNIGYFLADKFVVGKNLGFGYTIPNDAENSFGYGLGPFVRYYFLNEEKILNIFSQINYHFGQTKSGNNKSNSNGFGFKAGAVVFFNSSVGLEISLDYSKSKLIPKNSNNSSSNIIQLGLGFQIHLEKK